MDNNSPGRAGKKRKSFSIGAWICLIILSGTFMLGGLRAIVGGVLTLQRAWASQTWPTTRGIVQAAAVERLEIDGGPNPNSLTYQAAIRYEFQVDGKIYHGNRVSYGDYGSGNPAHAKALAARYGKGKAVMVHYRAANPQICVLEPGTAYTWVPLIVGLVFLHIGLLVGYLPFYILKRMEISKRS